MVREKKKGESGAATSYISRKQAMRKLQLNLKDFRRLCILKGIYPHEPKHKKTVNKGNSQYKTYYFLKDILFLSHEPLIQKFRDFKVFLRKLRTAQGQREGRDIKRLLKNGRPVYKIDHIVKERYPTFVDALRDLDDAISMCFLFSTFPNLKVIYTQLVHLCRKLTVEFMHFAIESRALRKVFISIKGYYFQVEIQDQKISWVMPHQFGFSNPEDVDYKIMSTFTTFYTTLLGFVNFKLFHSLNLKYPPTLTEKTKAGEHFDTVAALTQTVKRISPTTGEDEPQIDEFLLSEDANEIEELKKEEMKIEKLKKLFDGTRFFLNREVPREPFTFAIRCFGGQVSWDESMGAGSTYQECDETITHQLVDRPAIQGKQFMNRYYIQPQWVFDSINERKLLPTENYFPGVVLPPHLSPFVEEREWEYVPPEKRRVEQENESDLESIADDESEAEIDEDEEEKVKKGTKRKLQVEESEENDDTSVITPGKVETIDTEEAERREKAEEKRLAIMMLPKRKKLLYERIMKKRKRLSREVENLKEKRKLHDKLAKTKTKKNKNV